MTSVARVVLDSPLPQLDRLFDYRVPAELEDDCVPGVRVKVPLRTGARMSDAYVVEVVSEGDWPGELSPVEQVVSPVPVLAPEIWTLARAVADRAAGVASDVLRLAVPTRQVRAEKAWLARDTSWSPPAVEPTPVTGYGEGVLEALLADHGRAAVDAVPHPVDLGTADDPVWVPGWAATLAQAASQVVAREQSAVLAVPDFRDVTDLERALLAVLPPERVVRFDAKQTNGQRAKALLQARTHAVVAIGNRTAAFAPATELGLVAMWDDGDASFVEPRAPYVHTRDVALVRTAQSGAALLFLAHARSTDVQRLVELHWLQEVAPYRVPTPKVIPTAQQASAEGFAAQARIPSTAWRAAREASQHGPVLVQVANPGFGTGLVCADCGERAHCRVCGGPLGSPHRNATPQCRFCGALAVGFRCPTCGGGKLKPVGQGAQRTADELGRAFPGTRIVVADGSRPLDEVPARPAVVVATRGAEPSVPAGTRACCCSTANGSSRVRGSGCRRTCSASGRTPPPRARLVPRCTSSASAGSSPPRWRSGGSTVRRTTNSSIDAPCTSRRRSAWRRSPARTRR